MIKLSKQKLKKDFLNVGKYLIKKNKILRLMPNLSIKNNNGFIPYTKNYEDDYLGFIKCLNELGKTAEYPENLLVLMTFF